MTALALLSLLVLLPVNWTGTDAQLTISDGKPNSYMLHLEPNIMENMFNGTVTIDFVMNKTTSILVLNQRDLNIKSIELIGNRVRQFNVFNNQDMLVIYYSNALVKDKSYRMTIKYSGILNDMKQGFYRSRYIAGNETKWIATTHFEPMGARLAFPCWDEPIYKATFNISITHLKNYTTVLSNMPVMNKTDNGHTFTTTFEPTKRMSTYVLAFVVSDYVYRSDPNNKFRIYTTPDSVRQTEYALRFSVKAMEKLDEYTALPYFEIVPKMDQVTIMDFDPGAMENWGLVTYRKSFLLYEKGVTSTKDKEYIATTIAHEFVHQWFGNLVSPSWWEFIWLNEGFANYFQVYITEKVEPTWRTLDLFAVSTMQWGAFIWDGVLSARSLNKEAKTSFEIRTLFDAIAYHKGGCIIRMFSHILTEDVFQTALRNYLRANSFDNADSDNLIKHLQDAAGKHKRWSDVSLSEIAETWLMQPGYPVVTVKQTKPGRYLLSQKRFLYYEEDPELQWWIPISYATNNKLNFTDTLPTHWMIPKKKYLTISERKADWILVNKQQTGYYRVNYDDGILRNLSKYLKSNMHHIHPVNRAQLIDDALTMARKNLTKYETALSLTLYLTNETDYVPWMTTFNHLDFLRNFMFSSSHYHIFKSYVRYIMHGLMKNVTQGDSLKTDHPTNIMKAHGIKWACFAEVKECLDYAHKEFNAWIKDPNYHLDVDVKDAIICVGLQTASEAVWNQVLEKLSESVDDIYGKNNPLEVMACSNNHTILEKFLIMSSKSETKIHFLLAVRAVTTNTNVSGIDIILKVLEDIHAGMDLAEYTRFLIVETSLFVSAGIMNNDHFLRLVRLLVKLNAPSESITSTMEQSRRNVYWITAYGPIVSEWLANNEMLFNSGTTTLTFASFLLIFSIFMTRYY